MLPVLIGAAVLLGGALIVANWDELVDWFKDFIRDLKATLKSWAKTIAYGARVFTQKVRGLIAIIHKLFYQNENKDWMEEKTIRKVEPSEVPEYIRRKAEMQNQESDITSEMENETQMTISM